MKTCLKGQIPELLHQYQLHHPEGSWEQFKNDCQQGYIDVQNQLRQDQGNICCYCEIDTKQTFSKGIDDFRVEHFHPKSDNKESGYNWALDWQNLLGCCHGGSKRYVVSSDERYITSHLDRHSDVLKNDFIWDDEILNPLVIPAFPVLFQTRRGDGSLSVLEDHCRLSGVDVLKANNCLHPEKLNLNTAQLKGLRKAVLDAINQQIYELLSNGLDDKYVYESIAKAELQKNEDQHWPAFFTTIRSYLGKSAEKYLESIDYRG